MIRIKVYEACKAWIDMTDTLLSHLVQIIRFTKYVGVNCPENKTNSSLSILYICPFQERYMLQVLTIGEGRQYVESD
jgi:hypothetical protein